MAVNTGSRHSSYLRTTVYVEGLNTFLPQSDGTEEGAGFNPRAWFKFTWKPFECMENNFSLKSLPLHIGKNSPIQKAARHTLTHFEISFSRNRF